MISVILTTYKRSPQMVKRAIDSVVAQSYQDWELLVIDDSPSEYENREDVEVMVKEYIDQRIAYIPLEKNCGGCVARNRGILESKGDYITFLDDDDMYLEDKLKLQIEALKDNRDAGWVSGYAYSCHIDDDGKILDKKLVKTQARGGMIFDDLILDNFIPSVSAMVKKEILQKVEGFDVKMPAGQDLDLWLRVAKESELVVVEKPLIYQCIHKGERVTRTPEKKLKAYELILEKYKDYMDCHPKAKAKYTLNQVKYLVWLKDKKQANLKLKEACRLDRSKSLEYMARFIYWQMTYGRK